MKNIIENDVLFVKTDHSIDKVIRLMSNSSRKVKFPGIAIVVDKNISMQGLITDGDIRRAYTNNVDFSTPIEKIMIKNPIILEHDFEENNISHILNRQIKKSKRLKTNKLRFIPVIDENKRVIKILDYFEILNNEHLANKKVVVFGMGFVGLTLAASLSNRKFDVKGIDIDSSLIKDLKENKIEIHEPGLNEMVSLMQTLKKLSFDVELKNSKNNVYIIAVGTPVNENSKKPEYRSLDSVVQSIGTYLKKDDIVMLRSTVAVGTTRKRVIPMLEELSKLKAGKDFFVSFCPERTVEGNALDELNKLPQIIGGYSNKCELISSNFWNKMTPTVIKVSSLEASELVKLANNTFRDLSFAFSNNLSMLCDIYNINAHELINSANKGYERNPIPSPSPGVGGYCLTKDPYIYNSSFAENDSDINLGKISRKSNEEALKYPIKVLNRFSKKINKPLKKLNVSIIGMAFKGIPETNDLRGSASMELINKLENKVNKIFVWDAIVSKDKLNLNNLLFIEKLNDHIEISDALIFMNNHPDNRKINFLNINNKELLVFDGWAQFDSRELEKIKGITYSTMGYITD